VIKNGYAYEAGGSVYFDTVAFDGKNDHVYARLEPGSKGNKELIDEGEGLGFASLPYSLLTFVQVL
jgi:cysteinyl-tRNA synthetase